MSKIIIVGLGALGSHVALALRNMPQGLKLVDFDRVEQKNTLSQFHSNMGLRRNKAQALQQSLQGMWGVRADAIPHKLVSANAKEILEGAPLVIDCTDNIAARTLLKSYCVMHIPLLHGAISADGSFAQVLWTEMFKADAESGDGATCEDGENLPFHVMVGSIIAQTAKTFLKDGKRLNFQVTPSGMLRV